ncbi:MAG TPA: PaaI family thioesterase [Bdellovibrionales bacterium]|nr:PaaI family thioesterase [Bdellovibrionales bacterium]
MEQKALQDQYAPNGICFGCGPANTKGLRIKSYPKGDKVVAEFKAESYHQAFPGVLNGGIIGSLLDCHSNWTAAYNIMKNKGMTEAPCTVTAEYAVKLTRPTPADAIIHLEAWVTELGDDRATVEATLTANGKVCATCKGLFVAVKPGHPAYHRWG